MATIFIFKWRLAESTSQHPIVAQNEDNRQVYSTLLFLFLDNLHNMCICSSQISVLVPYAIAIIRGVCGSTDVRIKGQIKLAFCG